MSTHRRSRADLPPTARQLQVLRLIEEGRASQGYSPTVRELIEPLGVCSTQAVQCLVDALRRKGLVVGERGSARTGHTLVTVLQLPRELRAVAHVTHRARRSAVVEVAAP